MVRDATGWLPEHYLERTDRLSFCPGTTWTIAEAKARLDEIQSAIAGRRVIAIGAPAARLVDAPEAWCEWAYDRAAIPHTSGVNLAYNDPEMRPKVVAFLKDALR